MSRPAYVRNPGLRRRDTPRVTVWIGAASAALSALAILAAAGQYIFGAFSTVDISVSLPPAVEFRCSNPAFDPVPCLRDVRHSEEYSTTIQDFHMTVTGALAVEADGAPSRQAAIRKSTVRVYHVGGGAAGRVAGPWELTGLWSGDFVPGQPFSRRQISVRALAGGEIASEEVWYQPLPIRCPPGQACDERRNYLTWAAFAAMIWSSANATGQDKDYFLLDFAFFTTADGGSVEPIRKQCVVDIGPTAVKMVSDIHRALYVTSPCHALCEPVEISAASPAPGRLRTEPHCEP